MTAGTKSVTEHPTWKALRAHHDRVHNLHLRKLFADDPGRSEKMTAEAAGIYLDYSKNRITAETLRLLLDLAEATNLRARIDAMFRGEKINVSERRAALHVALRAPRGASILVDGENVAPAVHAVLDRMADFSDRVRSGDWKGHTGKRIHNVVNIGIGGSDLGPVMAYEALKHYSDRAMTFRFVSNVDGTDFAEAVRDLDAALLDEFGDWPLDDDRDWPGKLPRHARWLSRDRRALSYRTVRAQPSGADGPAGHLV